MELMSGTKIISLKENIALMAFQQRLGVEEGGAV